MRRIRFTARCVCIAAAFFFLPACRAGLSDPSGVSNPKDHSSKAGESMAQLLPGSSPHGESTVSHQLLCMTQTEEEAVLIAQQYGIELESFRKGVAVFTTQEDPQAVIDRGKKNGWAELYKNQIYHAN